MVAEECEGVVEVLGPTVVYEQLAQQPRFELRSQKHKCSPKQCYALHVIECFRFILGLLLLKLVVAVGHHEVYGFHDHINDHRNFLHNRRQE